MPRLKREDQVKRNRELVVEAARRVFLAEGYAGATLEQIAEEAGFSKGVVYSQFESKADLFMTLLEQRIEERAVENERAVAGLAAAAAVRALIRAAERDAEREVGWAGVLIEFRLVASRDKALNRRYAEAHARSVKLLATLLEGIHARDGRKLEFAGKTMAELVLAVGAGVALERAANPAALPQRSLEEMFVHALGLGAPRR